MNAAAGLVQLCGPSGRDPIDQAGGPSHDRLPPTNVNRTDQLTAREQPALPDGLSGHRDAASEVRLRRFRAETGEVLGECPEPGSARCTVTRAL